VLASVKSNLGPAPDALAYRLVEAGEYGVARVQWEGVTNHTARVLLAPSDDDDHREVDGWLRDYLEAEGKANARDVIRDGKLAGFSEDQVKKARRRVGAESIRQGFGKGSTVIWAIGAIDAIDAIDDAHKNPASMAPIEPSAPVPRDSPRLPHESLPGMTDRVKLALANAEARLNGAGAATEFDGESASACGVCRQEMFAPASIKRGICEGCYIADKHERGGIETAGLAT
jgi:hypothetical protein